MQDSTNINAELTRLALERELTETKTLHHEAVTRLSLSSKSLAATGQGTARLTDSVFR